MVLAGGRSSRMGTAKAALEWHGSTLLRRTLGVLARAVDGPLLVVRGRDQSLPQIPPHVKVVDDPEPGLGPLQGIAAGLAALADRAYAAFVCSTDLPFLHPVFVRRVLTALTEDYDVVLPVAGGYPQPLAAAYRVTLEPLVAELLMSGERRLTRLVDRCATLRLDDAALLADPTLMGADPVLDSVVNVNSADQYQAARRRRAPQVTVECSGAGRNNGRDASRTVRAATLSGAVAAARLAPSGPLIVTLNGERICLDGDIPLVAGDIIAFRCADADG